MNFYGILTSILDYSILNNSVSRILFAIALYVMIFFFIKELFRIFIKKLKKIAKNSNKNIRISTLEIISNLPKYFFLVLGLYLPLKSLILPPALNKIIDIIFFITIILQIIHIIESFSAIIINQSLEKGKKVDKTTKNALELVVKIVIRIIGILLLLTNIGIEVTPLIASLGLGGIAVAFALQNILGDLFSSFSILLSKPFKVGDRVDIGGKSGTVKDITLKATHMIATKGNEVIIPNSEVLKSVVENFSPMEYRRVRFDIGVTYSTNLNKLKTIPEIIKKIIDKVVDIEFERAKLVELGTSSVIFRISYVVKQADYDMYLERNEAILFGILGKFEKEKIDIAYPTQVIYQANKDIYNNSK